MRLSFLAVAAMLPLAACGGFQSAKGREVASSGSGAKRDFAASGFTKVSLRGSDDVEVRVGPAFAVHAEGEAKVLDELDIRVDGDTLNVARKETTGWFWSGRGAKVTVTMPRVLGASVAGSGDMTVQRGEGAFSGAVAGSGNLDIADLQAEKLDLSIAGSGDLKVRGRANGLSASVTGSGDIHGDGLTATSASISVAGSGNIRTNVSGGASVSIVGSGDVYLGGGARCAVSTTGSGEAHCS